MANAPLQQIVIPAGSLEKFFLKCPQSLCVCSCLFKIP